MFVDWIGDSPLRTHCPDEKGHEDIRESDKRGFIFGIEEAQEAIEKRLIGPFTGLPPSIVTITIVMLSNRTLDNVSVHFLPVNCHVFIYWK